MAYNARVYRILIASPSDVEEEREIVANVIQEWNDLHSFEKKTVLLPLRWETHSAPQMGFRPQEIINKEVVDYCDMAVGVFWTRVGSPTGEYASGTIEEIERVGNAEKIVMLYFSNAKVDLESVDIEQYQKLKEFKKKTYPKALVENYKNILEFRDKFTKQLEIKLRQVIVTDEGNDSLEAFDNSPKLEVGLIDIKTQNKYEDKIDFTVPIFQIALEEIESILKEMKLQVTVQKVFDEIQLKLFKENSRKISFYLKNVGAVGIRDLYIEFRLKKSTELHLTSSFSALADIFLGRRKRDNSEFTREETKDEFIFYINYLALQPQRTFIMNDYLMIYSKISAEYTLNYRVFADSFSIPLSRSITIDIKTSKMDFDVREFIVNKYNNNSSVDINESEFEEVK